MNQLTMSGVLASGGMTGRSTVALADESAEVTAEDGDGGARMVGPFSAAEQAERSSVAVKITVARMRRNCTR